LQQETLLPKLRGHAFESDTHVEGDHAQSDREFATVSSLVRRASVLALFLNTWHERAEQVAAMQD
jgi:hypothetical protein